MSNIATIWKHRRNAALRMLALMALAWCAPVWSANLDEAKLQGLVGEQANGYLGAVKPNTPAEIKSLIADINQKRKSEYQAIAQRNKTELQAVEALAAKTAIERTPPGQYVRLPSGEWIKK